MTRQEPLIDKAKRLTQQARLPRFFNVKGRRWHPTWQIYLCHLVYTTYAPSWRRAAKFMRDFYGIEMEWSCWRKAIMKWPIWAWHALARASAGDEQCLVAAIDGTTLARSNPSQHYLHRIDREQPVGRPIQEVVMIDVARRKFLAWRVRSRQRGEKCDVLYLLGNSPVTPDGVLLDKGFDSEPLHAALRERGVWSVAPTRKNCRRGRCRKQLRDFFDHGLYWQRNLVESLFSALKRLFGVHVRARTWRAQRAEIFSKFIAYNIGALQRRTICHRAAMTSTPV